MNYSKIKEKFNKISFKQILFVASIVIAAFFLVLTFGKVFESPLKTRLNALNILYYYEEDNSKAIVVDNYGSRISFLNDKKEVIKNTYFDDSTPITNVKGIIKYGKDYYVYGVKKEKNSIIIANDRVVKYSSNFQKYEIIFDEKREFKSWNNQITDVVINDGKLYVSMCYYQKENSNSKTCIYSIDLKTKEKELIYDVNDEYIYNIKYTPKDGNIYLLKYFDSFEIKNNSSYKYIDVLKKYSISEFNVIDKDNIVWHDINGKAVYLNDEKLIDGIYTIGDINNGNKITCFPYDYSKLIIYDIATKQINEYNGFKYSLQLIIFIWIKCISVIYILILIIILVVKAILKLYKDRNYEILKNILFGTIMTFIVVCISFFYINFSYDNNIKAVKNAIDTIGGFLTRSMDDGLIDAYLLIPKDGDIDGYKRSYEIFDETFGAWVNDEINNGDYEYVVLYKIKGNSLITLYDSSYTDIIGAILELTEQNKENIKKSEIRVIDYGYGNALSKYIPIYDLNDNLSGALEVGYNYDVLLKQTFSLCLELSITILLFLTIFYIFSKEIVAFYYGLKKYHETNKKKNDSFGMVHSLSFFNFIASSLDVVIFVLIIRDMLTIKGIQGDDMMFLITIPTFLIGFGYFISYFIYSFLIKRFSIRKIAVMSSILITICLVFFIFVIKINSFILFCVLTFIISILREILYFIIHNIPASFDNERERYDAFHDISMGNISSSVIGTLLGGFIAQKFGNVILYLVAAIVSVPIILLYYFFIPKNYYISLNNDDANVNGKNKLKNLTNFFVNPMNFVFILLLVFPVILVDGYKSFIFPLFTAELNWSKTYISNFTVLIKVLVLVVIGFILNSTKKINQRNVIIYCMLIMGIVFIGFYINTSVLWLLAVLFIQEVFAQTIDISKNILWPKVMSLSNIDKSRATSILILIENVFLSFRNMFLSMLIVLAGNRASVLLGVFCIVCCILFAIFTRKLSFSDIKKSLKRNLVKN